MHSFTQRRRLLLASAAAFFMPLAGSSIAQSVRAVEVWKDPNCGCCHLWVEYMEKAGFTVTVHDTGNNAIRARLRMPQKFASCHTALINGYVIEGHVPVKDIQQLLTTRPDALGLAVPGMKVGTPGMDGPSYNGRSDPYDVLLVLKDGNSRVFRSYARLPLA